MNSHNYLRGKGVGLSLAILGLFKVENNNPLIVSIESYSASSLANSYTLELGVDTSLSLVSILSHHVKTDPPLSKLVNLKKQNEAVERAVTKNNEF